MYIEHFQHPSPCHKVNSPESFSTTEKILLASTGLFHQFLNTVVKSQKRKKWNCHQLPRE